MSTRELINSIEDGISKIYTTNETSQFMQNTLSQMFRQATVDEQKILENVIKIFSIPKKSKQDRENLINLKPSLIDIIKKYNNETYDKQWINRNEQYPNFIFD